MADSNSLRVIAIFETCARLDCGAELAGLAAHIYHRFFKIKQEMSLFELYTFAAAAIKLAHWFYEKSYNGTDTCLTMCSVIHGPGYFVDHQMRDKLEKSVDSAAKIICITLDYQINFKDTRHNRGCTPGLVYQQYKSAAQAAEEAAIKRNAAIFESPPDSDDDPNHSSSDEDDYIISKADRMLSKNDRYLISSHRFLLHYLKTIKMLVPKSQHDLFTRIGNIAWTILSDFHWSQFVTNFSNEHLACTSLMMAIESYRPKLENNRSKEKAELWKLLSQKWNLIFCDDLYERHLTRTANRIIEQYQEYERVLQHELHTHVIDPSRR